MEFLKNVDPFVYTLAKHAIKSYDLLLFNV